MLAREHGDDASPQLASEMQLKSKQGGTWRRADYHAWLTEAGFEDVSFQPITLVFARVTSPQCGWRAKPYGGRQY
jgi:hypothetical protein